MYVYTYLYMYIHMYIYVWFQRAILLLQWHKQPTRRSIFFQEETHTLGSRNLNLNRTKTQNKRYSKRSRNLRMARESKHTYMHTHTHTQPTYTHFHIVLKDIFSLRCVFEWESPWWNTKNLLKLMYAMHETYCSVFCSYFFFWRFELQFQSQSIFARFPRSEMCFCACACKW